MAKGWLDNFGKDDNYNDYQTHAPEGFQGDGYSNVGRNRSPAWGGQFQMGGELNPIEKESTTVYKKPFNKKELKNIINDESERIRKGDIKKPRAEANKIEKSLPTKETVDFFNKIKKDLGPEYFTKLLKIQNKRGNPSINLGTDKGLPFHTRRNYNPFTNEINIPKGLENSTNNLDDYLSEVAHAGQPLLEVIPKFLTNDIPGYLKAYTSKGDIDHNIKNYVYDNPNTVENYTHKKIQPKLIDQVNSYISWPTSEEEEKEEYNIIEDQFKRSGKNLQMGGVMPGAVGHMYARHGAPSKGPRRNQTDVTDASAQNGIDTRKKGQAIKLSGMTNPGEVNYAHYTPTLQGISKAKTKLEKAATKDFTNWYSDPATKEKFAKNTGLDPERMQDLIGKGLRTPMSEYDSTIENAWPMDAGSNAAYKSAWVSQQQGDPTAPKTGYISYKPQGGDIPEVNVYSHPVKDIIGHELAHASGFDTVLAPALYRALGLKLPTKKEMPDLAYPSNYMKRPEEVYSNFHELRLNLGLKPGEKVDRESLKKRVKADKHNATNFWQQYSIDPKTGLDSDKQIDKIVNAINTVAHVDTPQQDRSIQTAENGKEMQYYQQGLDWQPKTISQNGSKTSKFDFKKFTKDQKANTPLKKSIDKESNSEDSRRWFDTKEYKDQVKANQLAKDKAIVQDRKDKINKSVAAQKKSYTKDNWRQQLADETQATGDKFRMFPEDPNSFVDEYMNPGVLIGDMASSLGSAPLRAKQEDSYMPYATSIGVPLLTGGMEGLGTKSNSEFVSNLINPLNVIPGYHSAEKYIGNKLGNITEGMVPKLGEHQLANASNFGNKTKQFLKNNIFTDKTFNRLETIDNSLHKLNKAVNPLHHIEAQKSLDEANQWMDNWYNHPITKEKITEASSRYGPNSYNEKKLLENIENKNYTSGFESNLNKFDNFISGDPRVHKGNYGVSGWYLDINKDLSKRQNLVDKYIDPDMIKSTAIHEGNHGLTDGNSFIRGYADVLHSPFNTENFKPRLDNGSFEKHSDYLLDPTEINARLSEIRHEHNLKPGENLTPEKADEIIDKGLSGKSKIDPEFFNLINDKNKFRYMMNYVPAVVPIVGGIGAASQIQNNETSQYKQGGIIKDDRGQWDHPGEITEIGSNDITMKGVAYDVLGVSDTGDVKLMKPGKNYKFKGKKVTEYPMAKNGLRQEQKGLQNLDNLTNFTNYNTKQPGGWLDTL